MTTSKGDGAKKATSQQDTKPADGERDAERAEELDIQGQADRVLSGEATTVNTTGAAPGTTPMRDMDPAVRSGPVNAPAEGETDATDNSKSSK